MFFNVIWLIIGYYEYINNTEIKKKILCDLRGKTIFRLSHEMLIYAN